VPVAALITACALAASAHATEHTTPANIDIACNEHGAVVTAQGGATYYLGKQCDAARQGGGEGRWWYVASGFAAEIDGRAVRFSNELSCDIPYCRP